MMRTVAAVTLALLTMFAMLPAGESANGPVPPAFPGKPGGGPDGSPFAYRWRESTGSAPLAPAFAWNSIQGAAFIVGWPCEPTCGATPDNLESHICIPLGMAFPYYGLSQTCAWVGSNGYLRFPGPKPAPPQMATPTTVSAAVPNNLIAGFWTDLVPTICGGQVLYKPASAANPVFVVEFNNVVVSPGPVVSACSGGSTALANADPANRATFQIRLYPSGEVDVVLKDVSTSTVLYLSSQAGATGTAGMPAGVATIGMEDPKGAYGLTYVHAHGQVQGRTVRFFPNHAPTDAVLQLTATEDKPAFSYGSGAGTAGCPTDPDGDLAYGYSYPSFAWPGPTTPPASASWWSGYCYSFGAGDQSYTFSSLAYTPLPNTFGPDVHTFTVQDSFGFKGHVTVNVDVLPVNDPPSFTPGPDLVAGHNAGPQSVAWATDLSAGPLEDGQPLAFTVWTDAPELFSVQPHMAADGTLTFTPDHKGTATVHVGLCDTASYAPQQLCTDAAAFTITLEPGKGQVQPAPPPAGT